MTGINKERSLNNIETKAFKKTLLRTSKSNTNQMLKLDKNKRYNLEHLFDEQIKEVEKTMEDSLSYEVKIIIEKKGVLYHDEEWNVRTDISYTCDALELFPNVAEYKLKTSSDEVKIINPTPLFGITSDKVVQSVMNDLNERSKVGVGKYGVTLEREDLSLKDWLQHAYEETLDKANYLKRAIMELEKKSI